MSDYEKIMALAERMDELQKELTDVNESVISGMELGKFDGLIVNENVKRYVLDTEGIITSLISAGGKLKGYSRYLETCASCREFKLQRMEKPRARYDE